MSDLYKLKIALDGTPDEVTALAEKLQVDFAVVIANCPTHGDFESRNVFGTVWTKCQKCTAEYQAQRETEEAAKEAIDREKRWSRKMGDAGIPERFQNRTLDTYIAKTAGQKRALEFAQEFAGKFDKVQESGRSAIFCGKPGTGKTHLAIGIGLAVLNKQRSPQWANTCLVQFTTVQRMVRMVKDAWRKDSELSETEVIDLLVEPDLLILDEIGVQFGTEFEKNLMFDVLNERYEKRRPTILISNLEPKEVKAFLGDRVYDRLREDGGECVPFDWNSHRGAA